MGPVHLTLMSVMTCTSSSGATPWACDDPSPFVIPQPSHHISDARPRTRVIVQGVVADVRARRWGGGPVLEVTLSDTTGTLCLAFLGRRRVAAVRPGVMLTAAGTVGSQRDRAIVINPLYWLHGDAEVPDA